MAYYRGYYSSRNWSSWHTSKLQELAAQYGGVDEDVRKAFVALLDRPKEMARFLDIYGKHYGQSARVYAEKTIRTWRTGTTRMSAQTTERLMKHLPPFLGAQVKYDLIRKLREHYRLTESHRVDVTLFNFKQVVLPLVRSLVDKAYTVNIPAQIEQRLSWLSDSDAEAARSLMAGAEAAAMSCMVSRIDEELVQMSRLLALNPKGKLSHTITLPYGIIMLNVRRGKPMEDNGSTADPGAKTGEIVKFSSSDQLLKGAIQNLTPDQMREISMKATGEAINIQVEAARADQRFENAARDIDHFVQTTQRLKSEDTNFTSSGSFNTASGTTSIKVTKDSSRIWVIAVIALAGLVLLLIMRR